MSRNLFYTDSLFYLSSFQNPLKENPRQQCRGFFLSLEEKSDKINYRLVLEQRLASLFEGGAPKGRRECRFDDGILPQSALWAASPLREGAKASTLLLS